MSAKSGVHIWSLQQRLKEFLNAANGVKFESGVFPVGDFNWQIIAYPNGNRFENYGSVMIYLRLISYPISMSGGGGAVTINFRIQCHETYSSSTFIETYYKNNDSKGWSSKNLLLSDVHRESIKKITFQIDVKILKIINSNNRITYEAPLKIYKNHFNLKWNVSPNLIERFMDANNGKWFESGNYSNVWCFKCAPNGYNEKNIGSCILFIQLCALPPNISKIKCKVKLFHQESDTKWTVKKDFGYDTKNAGWTKNKLSYTKLMKYDTITFRAEIEILGLYDLKGNKSTINNVSNTNYKYKANAVHYGAGGGGLRKQRSQSAFNGNNNKKMTGFGNNEFGNNYSKNRNYNTRSSYYANHTHYKHDEKEKEEDDIDDEEEEEEEEGSDDSEEEIALNTLKEMRDQIKYLTKNWKKLNKTMNDLKKRSIDNESKIINLQNEIKRIKNTNNNNKENNNINPMQKVQSAPTQIQNKNDDNLMNLFGDLSTNNKTNINTNTNNENVTFNTGGNDGFSNWEAF